jgi:hypothetical protein
MVNAAMSDAWWTGHMRAAIFELVFLNVLRVIYFKKRKGAMHFLDRVWFFARTGICPPTLFTISMNSSCRD